MKYTHQLVKVTNFMLYLSLLLPLCCPRSANSSGAPPVPGAVKTGADFPFGTANAVGNVGRDKTSHQVKGSTVCTRTVLSSSRIRNGSIAQSHSRHSGLFPSTLCQQYEFVGEGAERIQIVFSEFRLPSKLEPNECGETDILMVYFTVEGREELVETLCGDTLPKPILSNGPRLLLEFRSSYNNTDNKGFTGDFFFLTNFGIPTGHQPNQSDCTFYFFKNDSSQGWIQSPNFPGAYPRNIRCNYYFRGDPHDYVHIRFTYFDIEGILPCDASSASDYVEFSNFNTRDRKYAIYCGKWRELVVRSDGAFFRITMGSNDRLDGTGFRALYTFETTHVTTEHQSATVAKVTSSSSSSSGGSAAGPTTIGTHDSVWRLVLLIALAAIASAGTGFIKLSQD